ncbi:uncharacterized protein LOC121870613 isoform X2 [Homarus americanus]|nr:uncharacterized protein LOC121870613 isoform X2 [Homarus americanus]
MIGVVCQFVLLPAVGFGLCIIFQLPPYQALGVLILTCSPGGAFSNFFTYWVDGDLALSIIMTATSSVLAFGMMPFNLWAYSKRWTDQEMQVPYLNILLSLIFVTIPVIIGMLVRHYTRKWAVYISKVFGLVGWMGAFACEVMLMLRYWDSLVATSVNLFITAALVPLVGVVVAYILTKIVCFSHKVCRTVAIETGCQNMAVASNIMLLSFSDSQIRGQMVIFPVVYGVCQMVEVVVVTGVFQAWVFLHRDDVTEEMVMSVVDTSILTSVPVPAHKLSKSRIERMTGHVETPDLCRDQEQAALWSHTFAHSCDQGPNNTQRNGVFSSIHPSLTADEVDDPPSSWTRTGHSPPPSPHHRIPPNSPTALCDSPTYRSHNFDDLGFALHSLSHKSHSPNCEDFPHSPYDESSSNFDFELYPEDILESTYNYDSDSPRSPTLSNKGVPNMFPVTESDFPSDKEDSPLPYGSPIPCNRGTFHNSVVAQRTDDDECSGRDTPGVHSSNETSRFLNLESPSPTSPTSPSQAGLSRTFGFYHDDVRLGQTQQFGTFGRKKNV